MDRDFLFGVIAVQLGQVTPAQVMAAASAYFSDRSRTIPERLLADGAVSADRHRMIQDIVATMLQAHGGDAQKAVESVGGQRAVFASFGGSVVVDAAGHASLAPATGGDAGVDGDDPAVQPEAPGRYRFSDAAEIGRGGIGRVLVAFDAFLGREIAVKELLGEAGGSQPSTPRTDGASRTTAAMGRFLREARVTGQLEHPNIVPVYEVGQRADGTLYYTMKLVRGRTLAKALAACASLADRLKLLHHYVDLCNAVAYAHSRGVVHRDLKTENVMLGEFGETVVLDWGLAKVKGQRDVRGRELARDLSVLHDAGAGRTVDGAAIGTPAYMSPEQAEGLIDQIDERSDVWSLGAVLYEVLTGRPPFEGVTPFEIVGKVLKDDVAPPGTLCAGVPAELAAVASKALTRDPAKRYQRAGELSDEVQAFMTGGRIAAYDYSSWELVRRFVAKNKVVSAGLAAVLATVLVAVVLISLAYGRAEEARAVAEQQERVAGTNLAQAYQNRAEELNGARNFGAAHVYAAAALREYQRLGPEVPADRRAELESALYQAEVGRSLELERTLPGPGSEVGAMALSGDGRRLALLDGKQAVWLYALDSDEAPLHRVATAYPLTLRFTKDDRQLVVGDVEGLRWLDVDDLRDTGAEALGMVAWIRPRDPDVVAVYKDGAATLVTRAGGRPPVPFGPTRCLAWSADGALLFRGTPTGEIVVHDGATGVEKESFRVSTGPVDFCEPSADGGSLLVTSAETGVVRVDVARKAIAARLAMGVFRQYSVVPAPGGSGWLIGTDDGVARWSGRGTEFDEVVWQAGNRTQADVARSGRRVVTAGSGVVRVWKVRDAGRPTWLPSDRDPINVAFAPDGRRVVFTSSEGTVQLAEPGSEAAPRVLTRHPPSACTDVSFSPDGRHVASVGSDQWVRIHDVVAGVEVASRPLTRLAWAEGRCSAVRYAPDGRRLAVTAPDGRVHVLDAVTLQVHRVLAGNLPWPRALRYSPDGRLLVAGGLWGMLAWWDADTGRFERCTYQDDAGETSDLVVTTDNRTILTAGLDGWVRRVDVASGERAGAWRAHDAWVNRLVLSPDGTVLLTGSDDHRARLWDAASGRLLLTLPLGTQVAAVGFSPDGQTFAAGTSNAVAVFPLLRDLARGDGAALFDEASRRSGYGLSGFALRADGENEPIVDVIRPAPTVSAPDEIRGHVEDWFYPTKALPKDTAVELLDEAHRPFSPALVARPDQAGFATLRLPEGLEQFAARVVANGETTYLREAGYQRGLTDLYFRTVSPAEIASISERVGVPIAPGTGHVVGAVWWGPPLDKFAMQPVGCTTVTDEGGARAYFAAPTAESRVHPDPRLTTVHPASPWFYLFNLAPGEHRLTFRVGEAILETTVIVHAGSVTKQLFLFPSDRFADNPTPSDCLADWPPAPGSP